MKKHLQEEAEKDVDSDTNHDAEEVGPPKFRWIKKHLQEEAEKDVVDSDTNHDEFFSCHVL